VNARDKAKKQSKIVFGAKGCPAVIKARVAKLPSADQGYVYQVVNTDDLILRTQFLATTIKLCEASFVSTPLRSQFPMSRHSVTYMCGAQ
jgi:hypothetical protein